MDFYGFDRANAVAHCDSLSLGRAGADVEHLRAWSRLRPEHVVELLDTASADARGDARNLAALVSRVPWRIQVQAAAPGKANQLVSNVREVTLAVAGRDYKLHCTEAPFLQLERITLAA